ncbi:hypothetical protein [Rhodococcus sp. NPDC127528]|uniref:hypothetical protein n=1 Tax=unclassified Rhodococcus (in: high G+C Gram-positive bacteria) TaxID=192944 RepID=UPI003635908F
MSEDLDLDALTEAAGKATPGPWAPYDDGAEGLRARAFVSSASGPIAFITNRAGGDPGEIMPTADAEFIAAASPDVVLALVARVKTAEATMEFANWQREFHGRRAAEARLAKVQELLTTPGFDDHDLLREALGGDA